MHFPTNNPHWCELIAEHKDWLSNYDPQHLKNWEKLRSNNDEAAMCEAEVRRLLQCQGVTVNPNEDLNESGKQPDFKCSKDGHVFYVEVTCITIQKVTEETNIPSFPEPGARHYSSLNHSFWSACKRKVKQCSNMNHPTIVAVGTFHSWASSVCVSKDHIGELLTGEGKIAWEMNHTTGEKEGDVYQSTILHSAVFLRPDKLNEIGFVKNPVSGLLICGFGIEPPKTLGVLHPNPSRPFDKTILSVIQFCEVTINKKDKNLFVYWTKDEND